MMPAWTQKQYGRARLIWLYAEAYARWFDRGDPRFFHWRLIMPRSRAILLASRAGLPVDLIAWVSGMPLDKATRANDLMRALARNEMYRAAAEAQTQFLPVFGPWEKGEPYAGYDQAG